MFGLSSLPQLVGGGGGLVCESVGKLICCQIILTASSPGSLLIFHSIVIRLLNLPPLPSGRVRRLLLDLGPYEGTDPLGMFPFRKLLMFWPPVLVYSSFLACWRQANITPILKGPPSTSVANY